MGVSVRGRGTCGTALIPSGPALVSSPTDHSPLRLISSRKVQDSNNLKQQALALHGRNDAYNKLPPGYNMLLSKWA